MEENRRFPVKWMWALFCIHLAGLALTALAVLSTLLPFSVGSWYTWARRAVNLGSVVCLYLLSGRYRLAAMAKALGLVCGLLTGLLNSWLRIPVQTLMPISVVLSNASTVLALVALLLEYTAHAKTVPADRNKWHIFLACRLAVTLLSTVSLALLQPVMSQMVSNGETWLVKLWNILAQSVNLAMGVIYLMLLYRAIQIVRKEVFVNGNERRSF